MNKSNTAANPMKLFIDEGTFETSFSKFYYSSPIRLPILKSFEDNNSNCVNTNWGSFLNLLALATVEPSSSFPGWSNWNGGITKAKKNAMTILVLSFPKKFDIEKMAPQFAEIERASYMTYDPETGAEIFCVMFPLMRPITHEKFLILKPSIQKWADGDGSHPPSNPSSYKVGRFCGFPSYSKARNDGPNVESVSPGWMLDENAFDELLNTGVLTLA